jgi:hypothetical protein
MRDDYRDLRVARLTAEQRAYLCALSRTTPVDRTWPTIRAWFILTLIAAGVGYLALVQF